MMRRAAPPALQANTLLYARPGAATPQPCHSTTEETTTKFAGEHGPADSEARGSRGKAWSSPARRRRSTRSHGRLEGRRRELSVSMLRPKKGGATPTKSEICL